MMNRSIALLPVFILLYAFSFAQDKLVILGAASSHFLEHTVAAKENWYMLGRMYNQRPKDLASYNNTTIDQPLTIGKVLLVPLNESNFTQSNETIPGEDRKPLYHHVGEKEWMFRISQQYNKVPVSQLEKWNGITSDQIKAGMWLIVGYLKTKSEDLVRPATAGKNNTEERKNDTAPVASTSSNTAPKQSNNASPATEVIKPSTPALTDSTASAVPLVAASTVPVVANHKGGVFRKHYKEEGKTLEGNAGIFKSSSGWSDGKYYALINNIPVGTIIKVTFSSTKKSIYAKVLGQLPEMKESQGLSMRVSDAAASELGADLGKFFVEVTY